MIGSAQSALLMRPHLATLGMENDALAAIASAEKNRKREELRKSLMADVEANISGLPIAAIGHTPAPSADE